MDSRVWAWEWIAGVFWAGMVAAVYLLGGFERVELMSYDWRMRAFAAPPADRIVIVAIDNPSVKELSAWPWPRGLHARMVETLVGAGARVIAFDIDFSTPRDAAADARFARSVRRADRVVIPAFQDGRALETGVQVEYANLPYPALHRAARAVGSINLPVDPDGVLRRSPTASTILGEPGWSFAVEVARVFLDDDRSRRSDTIHQGLRIGDKAARLGNGPDSYIRFFGGPSTFPSFSYADVAAGRVDPALFKGKIVLIGATSLELQDLRPTPFPGLMAGVEIQANAVETLLAGAGYRRTGRGEILAGMAGILGLWTLVPLFFRLRPQRNSRRRAAAIGVAGCLLIAAIGVGAVLSFRALVFMDTIPLAATGFGQVLVSLIAGYISAERRIEFQSENLQALYRMGEETRAVTSIDRLADLLFAQTRHLLAVDRLGIDLWDATPTTERVFRDARGSRQPLPLAAYEDLLERLRRAAAPIVIPRLLDRLQGVDFARPIRSSLFLPLIAQNRPIGALHVHRDRPTAFTEDDAKVVLTLATQAALNIENSHLLDETRTLFQRSLEAFSTALDFKDNDTGGHSQRVSAYAVEIARRMGIGREDLDVIARGALLHDIGKIAVPDRVLLKPGALSDEEWTIMRKHPETGYSMLKTIRVPEPIAEVVRQHHERYDGRGYPAGRRGREIVLGARIFSVADLYDAMTNDRPYRKALPIDQVLAEIRKVAGSQLDPEVVEAFLGISAQALQALRAEVQRMLTGRQAAA